LQSSFFYFFHRYTFSLKIAELHAGGPNLSEIKYDTIRLTEEIKTLDGCIIDCRYFEHQWLFIKQRHTTAIIPMEGAQLWVNSSLDI
jgi:hypothetical protein